MEGKYIPALLLVFPLLAYFGLASGGTSTGVVLPQIMETFGIGAALAGLLGASRTIIVVTLMPISGLISDRVAWRTPLVTGFVLNSVGLLLASFAPSYDHLIGFMMVSGFGWGLLYPPLYKLLGGVLPARRGLILGVANFVFYSGGFFGPWFAALLAADKGWRVPYQFFGVMILCFTLPLAVQLKLTKIQAVSRNLKARRQVSVWKILRRRNTVIPIFAMFTASFGYVNSMWMPKFLLSYTDLVSAGFILGIWNLFGGVGAILFGTLSDKFSRKLVYAVTSVIGGTVGIVLYRQASGLNFLELALFAAVFGLLVCHFFNVLLSLVQDVVESEDVATVTGLAQAFSYVAGVFSLPLIGVAIESVGMTDALTYGSALPYVISGLIALAYRTSPRKANSLNTSV